VYIGVELLALSVYAMVAFDRDSGIAAESAIKYFVLGAIASGALLYGMSLIYGLTGTLDLEQIAVKVHSPSNLGVILGSCSSSSRWPSSSARCVSTCGCPIGTRARHECDSFHQHGAQDRSSRWPCGYDEHEPKNHAEVRRRMHLHGDLLEIQRAGEAIDQDMPYNSAPEAMAPRTKYLIADPAAMRNRDRRPPSRKPTGPATRRRYTPQQAVRGNEDEDAQ